MGTYKFILEDENKRITYEVKNIDLPLDVLLGEIILFLLACGYDSKTIAKYFYVEK